MASVPNKFCVVSTSDAYTVIEITLVHFSSGKPWEWQAWGYVPNGGMVHLDSETVYSFSPDVYLSEMMARLMGHRYIAQDWRPA